MSGVGETFSDVQLRERVGYYDRQDSLKTHEFDVCFRLDEALHKERI